MRGWILFACLASRGILAARMDVGRSHIAVDSSVEEAGPSGILRPGTVLKDRPYRIERFLGAGSEGEVWLASALRDVEVRCGTMTIGQGKQLALKFFYKGGKKEAVARQETEIRVLMSVKSDNVLKAYEAFQAQETQGSWTIAMELAGGLEYDKCLDGHRRAFTKKGSTHTFASKSIFPTCQNFKIVSDEKDMYGPKSRWHAINEREWATPKPKHYGLTLTSAAKVILGEIRGFHALCRARYTQGDPHRGNRMILENGDVKIIDFGFAKKILEKDDDRCATKNGTDLADRTKGLQDRQYQEEGGIACCSTDATQVFADFNAFFMWQHRERSLGLGNFPEARSQLDELLGALAKLTAPQRYSESLESYSAAEAAAVKLFEAVAGGRSEAEVQPDVDDYFFARQIGEVGGWEKYLKARDDSAEDDSSAAEAIAKAELEAKKANQAELNASEADNSSNTEEAAQTSRELSPEEETINCPKPTTATTSIEPTSSETTSTEKPSQTTSTEGPSPRPSESGTHPTQLRAPAVFVALAAAIVASV